MHQVREDIDRPIPETVSQFEGVPSSIISDVTGNVGRTMDSGMKPIYRECSVHGTAITVKAAPGDNLIIHKAITLASPGDVLVIDANGYTETGHAGELMCRSCKANGLAGLVIDGAVRDRRGIEAIDFPVYSRGVHPQGPLKQDPGSVNVTVSCGGVSIEPGDIIVGDSDGIAVVPADIAERVAEDSRGKMASEEETKEELTEGTYLFEMNGYDELYDELSVVGPEDSIR